MTHTYIKNTKINIEEIENHIMQVLSCTKDEITNFTYMDAGLMNVSFLFEVRGSKFIYRQPGEGTNELVNRSNEKCSCELAKKWGIDKTLVYMDGNEGWKISRYIDNCRMPDYVNLEDGVRVAKVLGYLHSLPIQVEYSFKPFEDSCQLEDKLKQVAPELANELKPLKDKIKRVYEGTKNDGISPCFCHGDTYRYNWLFTDNDAKNSSDSITLIDWEYAGMADPGIDVGYYIIDAMYDCSQARNFIESYIQEKGVYITSENGNNESSEKKHVGNQLSEHRDMNSLSGDEEIKEKTTKNNQVNHYLAYAAIIAYYWYVWALYREATGNPTGDAINNWKLMAEYYGEAVKC